MLSRCRALNPLRLSSCKIGLNPWFRSYHNAIAKFTTIDPKGVPVSYKIGIKIGEPNESYVYVEPEVGNAIKSAIIRQLGSDRSDYRETLPLQFNHNSRHFSHKSVSLPRIEIPQNLGQSNSNMSPATLWLSGNWYAITLDGTPDESFERMSRESASELKGALEKLKDS
ncbi:hypothetical protein BGZ61DRAFT_345716 [Ilyonectria robusta]|uniref:uncharacterized protein n=1 Tax=Ilyonectria robusta TaxID=1079257 RepID=UPI001E8D0833|nr:uncharacterized protein BGZ61DRAFT_345716 [Ilyonectria robusta]KAH8729180.1 hypothetical protein BGZ61DRAFT_345716 [Ilyonectria robusta]